MRALGIRERRRRRQRAPAAVIDEDADGADQRCTTLPDPGEGRGEDREQAPCTKPEHPRPSTRCRAGYGQMGQEVADPGDASGEGAESHEWKGELAMPLPVGALDTAIGEAEAAAHQAYAQLHTRAAQQKKRLAA